MFNFFNELKNEYLFDTAGGLSKSNLIMIGNYLCYIENIKELVSVTSENVNIKTKDSFFAIIGQNLVIKEYSADVLCVVGNIKSIEVQ